MRFPLFNLYDSFKIKHRVKTFSVRGYTEKFAKKVLTLSELIENVDKIGSLGVIHIDLLPKF